MSNGDDAYKRRFLDRLVDHHGINYRDAAIITINTLTDDYHIPSTPELDADNSAMMYRQDQSL